MGDRRRTMDICKWQWFGLLVNGLPALRMAAGESYAPAISSARCMPGLSMSAWWIAPGLRWCLLVATSHKGDGGFPACASLERRAELAHFHPHLLDPFVVSEDGTSDAAC